MLRILAAAAIALAAVTPAWADGPGKRYLVGFRPDSSWAERDRALALAGAERVEDLSEFGAVIAEVPENVSFSAFNSISNDGPITTVEEDVVVNWLEALPASAAQPGLPRFSDVIESVGRFSGGPAVLPPLPSGLTAGEIPWGVRRVNAPAAWSKTKGEGVKVAVLDTGIESDHPDLAGVVAGGYNALGGDSTEDDQGHGTHVAGTIAAQINGRGVAGVAPGVKLYAVKVLDSEGNSSVSSIIKGLLWCGRNGIQVANLSLGAPVGSVFMRLAVKYAVANGVTVVAAAGNSSKTVEYPGGYPEVLAVSASDDHDRLADFSSRGPQVDFIAPGDYVRSTVRGGGYEENSGTSMATPHVTGLAALAVARGASSPAAVREALARASRSLGLKPHEQGAGLIDASLLK